MGIVRFLIDAPRRNHIFRQPLIRQWA
jgi:hypothetical protein